VVFVLAGSALGLGLAASRTAVAVGLAYGFVLFVVAAMFWTKVVLAMDPTPKIAGLSSSTSSVVASWVGL
jgi:hypothetical protein